MKLDQSLYDNSRESKNINIDEKLTINFSRHCMNELLRKKMRT